MTAGDDTQQASELKFKRDEFDYQEFRELTRARPLLPLEHLSFTSLESTARLSAAASEVLETGFLFASERVSIAPPVAWHSGNRTFQYLLQAWEPIAKVIAAWDAFGERRFLDSALAFSEDWLERGTEGLGSTSAPGALDPTHDSMSSFPLAIARRTYRLAYLLDVAVRQDVVSQALIERMCRCFLAHLDLLASDLTFSHHNNIGLHQSICHLTSARRFLGVLDVTDDYRLALGRLLKMIEAQFSPSGLHREHSPEYHLAVLTTLVGGVAAGLLDRSACDGRIIKAEALLPWLATPSGSLVPLGDSHPVRLQLGTDIATRFSNPIAQDLLRGETGIKTLPTGVMNLPDDGFAFARLVPEGAAPTRENESYLAVAAAFNSRTHKQADDLSFVWHDRSRPVLTDPGRFAYLGRTQPGDGLFEDGFWYADRSRIYVESTGAHNTVEIDGLNFPRKDVTPFGSALVDAHVENGLFVSECTTFQFKSIRHRRILIMRPSEFLIVLDWMQDRTERPHHYRQWFHFDPLWSVSENGAGFVATAPHVPASEPLAVLPLLGGASPSGVYFGQAEPEMHGWLSTGQGEIRPAPSLNFMKQGSGIVIFATLFCYGDPTVVHERTRTNVSLSRAQIVWEDGNQRTTVAMQRSAKSPVSVQYHSAVRPIRRRTSAGDDA